ncbi:MAG: hypothetical protein EA424_04330 [Planctomycetaceae bacterium]|nr:MAG: hypothetical protein EA424_04330 [Planctomycetaceae bacterium]
MGGTYQRPIKEKFPQEVLSLGALLVFPGSASWYNGFTRIDRLGKKTAWLTNNANRGYDLRVSNLSPPVFSE